MQIQVNGESREVATEVSVAQLLEKLPLAGVNLMDSFFAVSDRVSVLTQKSQVPWLKFDGSGRILRENVLVPRGSGIAVEFAGKRAGERKENGERMGLRWVAAGKFVMGSPEDEDDKAGVKKRHQALR